MNKKLLQSLAVGTFSTIFMSGNLIAVDSRDIQEQKCKVGCRDKYREEVLRAPGDNQEKDRAMALENLRDCDLNCGSAAYPSEADESGKKSEKEDKAVK
ncbi:MAG: hypothetical protein K2Y08_03305 [Alphaproteobacteria bacterium]|nr:hypothetical protein [Alphaproteobacteria bacterium]